MQSADSCAAATDVFHLLREKEKAAGVDPDPEIDAFLKASLQEGKASSASTSFIIRLLGLEVSFASHSCCLQCQ